jgi:putative PIN family toxin of toxin-antitoxin system
VKAVFDANVVIAGAGWRGESHLCLVQLARRRVQVFASGYLLDEIRDTASDLEARSQFPHPPWTILNWFYGAVRLVNPAALGRGRSRDPKDDPILAAALGASTRYLVTHDRDLLVLEKPFGIEIVTPRVFLSLLVRSRP